MFILTNYPQLSRVFELWVIGGGINKSGPILSLDREFNGEVIEIGREGEFATQRDVTRGRSDIRTFRVKIGIKESDGLLKTGMTVKGKIYCG